MTEYERLLEIKAAKTAAAKATKVAAIKIAAIVTGTTVSAGGIIGGTVYYRTNVAPKEEISEESEDLQVADSEESGISSYADAMLAVSMGTASEADYITVAEYYLENGESIQARDTLEKCYKQFASENAKEMLKYIVVDVAIENSAIVHVVENLIENLEVVDDFPEIFHLFEGEMWTYNVVSETGTLRNYTTSLADGTVVYFSTEKDADGIVSSQAFYQQNGILKQIKMVGQKAEYSEIALADPGATVDLNTYLAVRNGDKNYCTGDIKAHYLNGENGDVSLVTGGLVAGMLSGTVEVKYHAGKSPVDPYDLWNGIDKFKYKNYSGEFTEGTDISTVLAMNEEELAAAVTNGDSQGSDNASSASSETSKPAANQTASSKPATSAPSTSTSSKPAASTPSTSTSSKPAASAPSTSTSSTPAQSTPSSTPSSAPAASAPSNSSSSQAPSTPAPSTPVQQETPSTPAPSTPTQQETPSTPAPSTPTQQETPSTPAPSTPTQQETPSTPPQQESPSQGGSSGSGDTDVGWTPDLF